jgi:CubicO group peptidase (beta-lactamase class C family)
VGDFTKANFDRLGMSRTSLVWREDFAATLANGWNDQGQPQEHDQRSKVRAAGSMDTTISDFSKFVAALVRSDGLSPASRKEMTRPQLHIATAHQFPTYTPELPEREQRKDLHAGLGLVLFRGPQGAGCYKGGHDGQTANTMVCLEARQRCVAILSNYVRAEAGFAALVRFILRDTGVPYEWEHGDRAGKSEATGNSGLPFFRNVNQALRELKLWCELACEAHILTAPSNQASLCITATHPHPFAPCNCSHVFHSS